MSTKLIAVIPIVDCYQCNLMSSSVAPLARRKRFLCEMQTFHYLDKPGMVFFCRLGGDQFGRYSFLPDPLICF